jgi:inner membrane protein
MTWFTIFAATVFAIYFWVHYRRRQAELNSPLAEHRVGMKFIGQANAGRVWLGNREWSIRGPNLPVGARVRVTGVDGSILLVDRMAA